MTMMNQTGVIKVQLFGCREMGQELFHLSKNMKKRVDFRSPAKIQIGMPKVALFPEQSNRKRTRRRRNGYWEVCEDITISSSIIIISQSPLCFNSRR
jgi:hypothetical protein